MEIEDEWILFFFLLDRINRIYRIIKSYYISGFRMKPEINNPPRGKVNTPIKVLILLIFNSKKSFS